MVLVLMSVFWWVHRDPGQVDLGHAWNRVLADTSFVLLCLILTLAAVARFVPRLRRLVPWNRELGIAMFVTVGLLVVILLDGYVQTRTLFSF